MTQQVNEEKEQIVRDLIVAMAPSAIEPAAVLERAEELADTFFGWREIERGGLQ